MKVKEYLKNLIEEYGHVFAFLILLLVFSDPRLVRFPLRFITLYILASLSWFGLVELSIKHFRKFSLHVSYRYTLYALMGFGSLLIGTIQPRFGVLYVPLFIPVALISLLMNHEIALASGFIFSILASFREGFDLRILLYCFSVAFFAAMTTKEIYRRLDLVKSSVITSAASFLVAVVLSMFRDTGIVLKDVIVAFMNPLISAIVVFGLLPYVEFVSRIYSNIGLTELGNLNHPLLKLLAMQAPGTYYHSVMVANLAEAAAERIGANPVLARVASYYHDIGKIKRPNFFVENLKNDFDKNPHNELSPSLSHLVLIDHVKYGVELARKHRLPLLVEDIIPQHHGTRTQMFFFRKAKETTEDGERISEGDYKYQGPKPQFKEAGIIMLADSVEAAVRTLTDTKPQRVRAIIEKIVSDIFFERQLDESGL
ncbi:MAG: phosphodiesterase, partial [Thermotogae bacterium]